MAQRRATPVGTGLTALVASAVAAVLATAGSAFAGGLLGVLLAAVGTLQGSRRLLGAAVLVQFAGVVLAGVSGLPSFVVVAGAAGVALTWDVGEHAITVGEQLGRRARTRRLELVHAARSGALAVVGAGALYGLFRAFRGQGSVLALVAFVLGAVVLFAALDR